MNEVVVFRPEEPAVGPQQVPALVGISRQSVGAQGLALALTTFPPGASTTAHLHRRYETAIYTVEGAVALFYGNELEHVAVLAEGSFCYIPPDVPHKAYNLSETHASRFVSARNDPDDPENVVVTPTSDDGSSDERARELRKRFAVGGV